MINNVNAVDSNKSLNKAQVTSPKANNTENKSQSVDNSKRKYDSIEINKLIEDNEKRINEFKESIKRMIAKQGESSNLKLFGLDLHVTEEDSLKAQESIQDGGEYSIDAVATRIMDMAKSLANGDNSKISLLRDAVKKGFEAAGLEFNGGNGLPEISNKTYDEIMKRFDEWENEK